VRGDIYRLRAPKDSGGHQQDGHRYAVVVQSDHVPLPTWLVAPASTGRRGATFRPEIEIEGRRTRILVEQTSAVDPETRLGEFAGRLSAAELARVDGALMDVLGLR
jgi:mRNA interferase MazF